MLQLNPPRYRISGAPSGVFRPHVQNGFAHALEFWRSEGFGPIVEHVDGNGIAVDHGGGSLTVVVWPKFENTVAPEITPAGDAIEVKVDDQLSVWWKGPKLPGAADLDNGNPLDLIGVPVELADGRFWEVPQIREPLKPLLPRDIHRDRKSGVLIQTVRPEYESLWQRSESWLMIFLDIFNGRRDDWPLGDGLDFATEVLSLRYHFSAATQAALKLLDPPAVQRVIAAAIGWESTYPFLRALALSGGDSAEAEAKKKD